MKGIVIYDSKYNTTKEIAEKLRKRRKGMEIFAVEELSPFKLKEADFIILGSPIYYGRLSKGMENLLKDLDFRKRIRGRPLVIFTVSLWKCKKYLSNFRKFLEEERVVMEYSFGGKFGPFDRRKEREIDEFVEILRGSYGN